MTPVKNIEKLFTAVLVTVGIGLFLTGAHVGSVIIVSAHHQQQAGKKIAAYHSESAVAWFHKTPLKHYRHRAGPDGLPVASVELISYPVLTPHYYIYHAGFSSSVLHAPSLRGPPNA